MNPLKPFMAILFLLCCACGLFAQTEVTVVETDGTNSTIVVSEQGKIYFSNDRMYIDAGDGVVSDFAVEDIRKMTFNTVTAVANRTASEGLLLYPNPASSYFKIAADESQNLRVQLYALTGQLLIDVFCQAGDAVNISEFQSGIYFVKVNGLTFKLLKK